MNDVGRTLDDAEPGDPSATSRPSFRLNLNPTHNQRQLRFVLRLVVVALVTVASTVVLFFLVYGTWTGLGG